MIRYCTFFYRKLFICYLTETEEVGYDVIEVIVDNDSVEFVNKTTQD